MNYDARIMVAGQPASGKSSLIKRYIEGRFDENVPYTRGVDHLSKRINNNNINEVLFYDTGGETTWTWMMDELVGWVNAGVLCVENPFSHSLEEYLDIIKQKNDDMPIALVQTKMDKDDLMTSIECLERFAKEHGLEGPYYTSAKEGTGVKGLFDNLLNKITLTVTS